MKPGYLSEIFVSFQGEGAHVGRRHLFVRLAGCNLRCRYCDTPDSLERTSDFTVSRRGAATVRRPNPVTAGEIRALVDDLLVHESPIDAIALTGGEPLLQAEFVGELLADGPFPVPVLLETNGMLPRRLSGVLSLIDIISMDLKLPSNSGEPAFWDEHAAFVALAAGKDVYVKILVDATTADAEVARAAQLVARHGGRQVPTYLQPIVDAAGRATIAAARLDEFYRIARGALDAVRVVPQTHKLLGLR